MADEYQYFYEDEVYRINKRGNLEFGMVLENSELVSSDENSDAEECCRMKKGHIRVAWHPTGVEEVIAERRVRLADRSLMPGDVVRRMIKGKDTQRGYCRDIKVAACVQILETKQVISNVKSENLVPLEEFAPDIVACLDSWVGSIKTIRSKLTLRCPDGSRCIISDIDACGLDEFSERRDGQDNDFPGHRDDFYPGQTLYGPAHSLESAQWLHCTKEMKSQMNRPSRTTKVIVEHIETDHVGIHWQCRAYSKEGAGLDKEQPKFLVQGEDLKRLKLLNVFEPCTLQVGDRNYYVLREDDKFLTKDQWRRMQKDSLIATNGPMPPPKNGSLKSRNKTETFDACKKSENETPADSANKTVQTDVSVCSNKDVEQTNVTLCRKLFVERPPVKLVIETRNGEISGDEWDTEDTGSVSDTTSISSGSSSICSQGKKKRGPALMTKVLKKKKLRRAKKTFPPVQLKPGMKVVVETLSTSSVADVVWQDGSLELAIPSTQLYPIHHLDDQEFFPGDFVIENKEDTGNRIYGVVQSVDHVGRTAKVKWFKTYTSQQEPQPAILEENEMSVYDLKDHPDFQYRPGTVVIRVANFEGSDVNSTAGQVLDNYPEGMVRVWWVDGHISMSWPQDLYKVGEYDSDEGELWDDGSSTSSWETESEDCFVPEDEEFLPEGLSADALKPKLAANIEKARIAMARLEEIFTQNPALQTTNIMKQLLDVYKDCRYLDKLMGTSYFHESHFQGLLERVRERGRANVAQRVADQVSRLFHSPENQCRDEDDCKVDDSGICSVPASSKDSSGTDSISGDSLSGEICKRTENSDELTESDLDVTVRKDKKTPSRSKTSLQKTESHDANTNSPGISNSQMCARLCSLIKAQLVKAHSEVTKRFATTQTQMTLSEAFNTHSPNDDENSSETACPKEDATANEVSDSSQPLHEKVKDGFLDMLNVFAKLRATNVSVQCIATKLPGPDFSKSKPDDTSSTNNVSNPLDESNTCVEPASSNIEEASALPEEECCEGFSIMDNAPSCHKYKLTMFQPSDPQNYYKAVRKEIKLLRTSLPSGIWVKGFEDRMDLYSVMIRGPEKTPYEDGLFFFDFQLSADYPKTPPLCHYISYCSDRLNPNLYEDGKVCVSLLGTWSGKGTEVWTLNSTLLQVIISIQGLILVNEPYFNEAGYEKQKGTQQGKENSRMYNEMAVLKMVQSLTKILVSPSDVFKEEIIQHFRDKAYGLIHRLDAWLDISERYNNAHPITPTSPTSFRETHGEAISNAIDTHLPEFPLIPASKGFCLTLRKSLVIFREALKSFDIVDTPS